MTPRPIFWSGAYVSFVCLGMILQCFVRCRVGDVELVNTSSIVYFDLSVGERRRASVHFFRGGRLLCIRITAISFFL